MKKSYKFLIECLVKITAVEKIKKKEYNKSKFRVLLFYFYNL
jgi:hypothetical protein